jgi:hypothetical protein
LLCFFFASLLDLSLLLLRLALALLEVDGNGASHSAGFALSADAQASIVGQLAFDGVLLDALRDEHATNKLAMDSLV